MQERPDPCQGSRKAFAFVPQAMTLDKEQERKKDRHHESDLHAAVDIDFEEKPCISENCAQ